ncbi:MAG: WbqC family protein, partial [Thermoanaerobaculia bacterium]
RQETCDDSEGSRLMRCVILQPSYIPWRGYFDLIHRADVFVFYDDVQYDKGGWRNRNRIKTPKGTKWLTIPVRKSGVVSGRIPINAMTVAGDTWAREHMEALRRSYADAPYFDPQWMRSLYAGSSQLLADFTIATTIELAARLGIRDTLFLRSSTLGAAGRKTDRLIEVLREIGATHYLSGPSAIDYVELHKFAEAGIALEWMTYDYPEYTQLYPPFDPFVTVLDLLFMTGSEAPRYIWGDR